MGNQNNNDKKQHQDQHHEHHRDDVYQLNSPEQHQDYYDQWAKTYDDDFADHHGYAYPERVARLFAKAATDHDQPIADIGCGTGLIGEHLRQHLLTHAIHGFDISQGMLDVADGKAMNGKPIYDGLFLADITQPLPQKYRQHYLGLISTGTFTLGHLGPDALEHALSMGAKEALALIGINAQHFHEKSFDQAFHNWQARGMISPVIWHEVDIYLDPDAAETDSLTAWVAEFRIKTVFK